MKEIIPFQTELIQQFPQVIGNQEYSRQAELFTNIDKTLIDNDIESDCMQFIVSQAEESERQKAKKSGIIFNGQDLKSRLRAQKRAVLALRCTIGRYLMKESYSSFSFRLSDSPLLQQFCRILRIDKIKVPSASSLHRYEQMLPKNLITDLMVKLNAQVLSPGIEETEIFMSLDEFYADSTCLKANVHHPVDWIFLVDAVRSLMKGVIVIRKAGLMNRMDPPETFISHMNSLSMAMSNCRRQKDAQRKRKNIFRQMKKLLKKVDKHARKHMDLLLENRSSLPLLSPGNADCIYQRMKKVADQVSWIIFQAHERIIGGRKVTDKDKTLSLYDTDIQAIVRGKASAETEFGNILYIAEQNDGLIVDWAFYQDKSIHDSLSLSNSVEHLEELYGALPKVIAADTAFDCPANSKLLIEKGIVNCIKPRSPAELKKKLENSNFRKHQKRRAQTEGRLAILKSWFLQKASSLRGYENRERAVAMGILTHNLWVIARKAIADEKQKLIAA